MHVSAFLDLILHLLEQAEFRDKAEFRDRRNQGNSRIRPAIASDITIEGNGAVLVRDNSVPRLRFFYIAGVPTDFLPVGSLTLRNLTLQEGRALGGAGGGGSSAAWAGNGGFGGGGGRGSITPGTAGFGGGDGSGTGGGGGDDLANVQPANTTEGSNLGTATVTEPGSCHRLHGRNHLHPGGSRRA